AALGRITHCVQQLTEEQVWSRPRPEMNAVGNLLLHLAGNIRQWIISGVGGVPDDRNRPAEFAAKGPIPKAELLLKLSETVERAKATIRSAGTEELCRKRRIQSFDLTGVDAILHSVSHFRGHTQEIIHQTRFILGDKYKFAWVPQTK